MSPNPQSLDQMTKPGKLMLEKDENQAVRCIACAHRCLIRVGKRGICQVRHNHGGKLMVPWGYVSGLQADPIEKKPFMHLLPGSEALTFGMLGCNFHCPFCQNWLTSQTIRDPSADASINYIRSVSPAQVVDAALFSGASIIASSYNEPFITTEWAMEIFQHAQPHGIRCVYVSNGYGSIEALQMLKPVLAGIKIDLKSMQERNYRLMGGVLKNVLDTLRNAHEMGLWVEVVTLVIPGFNDNPDELWDAARTLVSISADIPWHVTAFHPDYKMNDRPPTPASKLQQAAEIGQEAGLHYVYAGNLPGKVGSLEDTHCPQCQARLIQRRGFTVLDYQITGKGCCPRCGTKIAGIWAENPETVNVGGWGFPRVI